MKVTFVLREQYELVLRMQAENEDDKRTLSEARSFCKKLIRKSMGKYFYYDTQADVVDATVLSFKGLSCKHNKIRNVVRRTTNVRFFLFKKYGIIGLNLVSSAIFTSVILNKVKDLLLVK